MDKTMIADASMCSSGCANWGECVNAEYGYECNTGEDDIDDL